MLKAKTLKRPFDVFKPIFDAVSGSLHVYRTNMIQGKNGVPVVALGEMTNEYVSSLKTLLSL